MEGDPDDTRPTLEALARTKLSRVLGPEPGARVFAEVLAAARLSRIATPDDLYAFSEALSGRGGFEAAVGAMLGVTAVLRGASARAPV